MGSSAVSTREIESLPTGMDEVREGSTIEDSLASVGDGGVQIVTRLCFSCLSAVSRVPSLTGGEADVMQWRFFSEDGRRVEEDLSATSQEPQADARVPQAHEYGGGA